MIKNLTAESVKNRIVEAVSSYQDEIVEFTSELVSIPTENPPGRAYKECIKVIARKLREIGLAYEILEVPGEVGHDPYPCFCLLGSWGKGEKTLYFHGHYDVVPASSKSQFSPHVKNGRLYGRGSSDMKGGLAAMIYAVRALKDCGMEPSSRIGLVFVPDEETGGALGSQYLAGRGLLGKDGIGMIIPEPTSGVIWNANRGALSMRVTVKGRPAHVGLHYEGINAFERMVEVTNALLELKKEIEARKTAYNIQPEAARRSVLLIGGVCEGGRSFNSVPGECSFTLDRRINPEEDLQTEKGRIFETFKKLKKQGIEMEIEILQEGESAASAEDDALAKTLTRSTEMVTGRRLGFEMCPGLLETRFYVNNCVPAFAFGPGILSVSHGPDEYIEITRILECAVIYALTALGPLK